MSARPPWNALQKLRDAAIPSRRKGSRGRNQERYDGPMFWVTAAGVVVVGASAIISGWTAFIMQDQLKSMNDQLNVMESQQRPWVTIHLAPSSVTVDLRDDWPRMISMDTELKNVGQTVATGVMVETAVVFGDVIEDVALGAKGTLRARIISKQEELCRMAAPLEDQPTFGGSVFPGETATFRDLALVPDLPGNKPVGITLVGCVSYQSYKGGAAHKTPFAFELIRAGGQGALIHGRFTPGNMFSGADVVTQRASNGNSKAD